MNPKEFINATIENIVKLALKREGFTTGRTTFRKFEEGFVKVLTIQHSAFNTPISASFDIIVGLYFPAAYGILAPSWLEPAKPLLRKVKIEDCQIRYSAKDLPSHIHLFLVDWQTDTKQFQENIQEEILNILAWFASIKSIEDCLTAQLKVYPYKRKCDFYVALTYAEQGNLTSATEILRTYLSQYDGPTNALMRIVAEASKRGMQV